MFSNNSYFYEQYDLASYEEGEGPPIIDKKSRLLAAVVQNEVGVLEDLLDSPEWYNTTDKSGFTLLQIAILRDNLTVFTYMMSIPDFPIDFVNKQGQTALTIALDGYTSNDLWMRQDFAYELIMKGASLDVTCYDGDTPLHRALDRSYNRVAMILIERGADVNLTDSIEQTPLELGMSMTKGATEVIVALLMHGATPSIQSFEDSVIKDFPLLMQEMLFLYLFDEYSDIEIDLDVILILIETKSPLLHELFKYPFTVSDKSYLFSHFHILFAMDMDSLKLVVEKFSNAVGTALTLGEYACFSMFHYFDQNIFMRNVNFILETELRPDLVSYIITFSFHQLFENLVMEGISKSSITELYCFLLSYGLDIDERDLLLVYKNFGYCELFKILLHMDIEMGAATNVKWIMPTLLYDVTMDLNQFLEHQERYSRGGVKELCSHFVHPELKKICLKIASMETDSESFDLPEMPLLSELARNVFRNYFIETFNIKTSRQFYTLLNHLPVSKVYKKIISYEVKLYKNVFYLDY